MSKKYNKILVFSFLILLLCSTMVSAVTYEEVKADNFDMFLRVWFTFGIIIVSGVYLFSGYRSQLFSSVPRLLIF